MPAGTQHSRNERAELLSPAWALRKGRKRATCDERSHQFGFELRLTVGAELLQSHAWILLTLRTGLRLGEQLALKWEDIDWAGQFLVVQRNLVSGVLTTPKSHQCRRADLSAQLATALREWRAVQQAR